MSATNEIVCTDRCDHLGLDCPTHGSAQTERILKIFPKEFRAYALASKGIANTLSEFTDKEQWTCHKPLMNLHLKLLDDAEEWTGSNLFLHLYDILTCREPTLTAKMPHLEPIALREVSLMHTLHRFLQLANKDPSLWTVTGPSRDWVKSIALKEVSENRLHSTANRSRIKLSFSHKGQSDHTINQYCNCPLKGKCLTKEPSHPITGSERNTEPWEANASFNWQACCKKLRSVREGFEFHDTVVEDANLFGIREKLAELCWRGTKSSTKRSVHGLRFDIISPSQEKDEPTIEVMYSHPKTGWTGTVILTNIMCSGETEWFFLSDREDAYPSTSKGEDGDP